MERKINRWNLLNRFLVGLAALSLVVIIPLYNSKNSEIERLQMELNKPKVIREYLDQDNNCEYDSYKLIKKYSDGREEIIPNEFGGETRSFRFYNQFGGKVEEAPRAVLNYVFNEWNYPDNVDSIRFESSLY